MKTRRFRVMLTEQDHHLLNALRIVLHASSMSAVLRHLIRAAAVEEEIVTRGEDGRIRVKTIADIL